MRTANERIEDLERRVEQLDRDRLGAVTAAYAATDAALRAMRDNKLIQGVHYRVAQGMMEQATREALATYPDLLEAVAYGFFPSRWKRQDA